MPGFVNNRPEHDGSLEFERTRELGVIGIGRGNHFWRFDDAAYVTRLVDGGAGVALTAIDVGLGLGEKLAVEGNALDDVAPVVGNERNERLARRDEDRREGLAEDGVVGGVGFDFDDDGQVGASGDEDLLLRVEDLDDAAGLQGGLPIFRIDGLDVDEGGGPGAGFGAMLELARGVVTEKGVLVEAAQEEDFFLVVGAEMGEGVVGEGGGGEEEDGEEEAHEKCKGESVKGKVGRRKEFCAGWRGGNANGGGSPRQANSGPNVVHRAIGGDSRNQRGTPLPPVFEKKGDRGCADRI